MGKIQNKQGDIIDCHNTKAAVMGVMGDKILCRCTDGIQKYTTVNGLRVPIPTFAHQYTIESNDENEDWKKFFGDNIMNEIENHKKLVKEQKKLSEENLTEKLF